MNTQQGEIVGQVKLTVSRAECYGGRRIHLRLEGLPGWLLDLLFSAGPFVVEASSSRSDRQDQSGPNSLLLGSTKVLDMMPPTPPPPTPAPEPAPVEEPVFIETPAPAKAKRRRSRR